jgi:hypothetical protein
MSRTTLPFPDDGRDPVDAARQRVEEDISIAAEQQRIFESARTDRGAESSEDTMLRLQQRRQQLKRELRDLDIELGAGSTHRTWLRRLPDWFWLPTTVTYETLRGLSPVRKAAGDPGSQHWIHYADSWTFFVNLALAIFYISVIVTLLGMVS